jgi:hypothetical protein
VFKEFERIVQHQFFFLVNGSSSKAAEVIEMVRNIHSTPSTVCLIVAYVSFISSVAFCIFTKANHHQGKTIMSDVKDLVPQSSQKFNAKILFLKHI